MTVKDAGAGHVQIVVEFAANTDRLIATPGGITSEGDGALLPLREQNRVEIGGDTPGAADTADGIDL